MKFKGMIIYVDEIAKLSKADMDKLAERIKSEIVLLHKGDNIYIASTPFKSHPNEKIITPKRKPQIEVFILS